MNKIPHFDGFGGYNTTFCTDKWSAPRAKFNILAVIKGNCLYRPCSDFMDMLRRLISCRIIIIIIIIIIITWFSVNLRRNCRPCGVKTFFWTTGQTQYRHAVLRAVRPVINRKERKK